MLTFSLWGDFMTVGQRIKRLRLKNNLTQEDIAKKIGVAIQTIYKYENEIVTNIPSDKIERMAVAFGVSPAVLMGWDESTTPEEKPDDVKLDENIIIYHRNGKTVKKKMSKEKMALLSSMLDALPDDDGEL